MRTTHTPSQVLLLLALLALCAGVWAQPPAAPDLIAQAEREAARLRDPAQRAIALADVALAWRQAADARWEKTWAQAVRAAETITDPPVAAPLTWRGLGLRFWPVSPDQARAMFDKALTQAAALQYAAQKALALREIGLALFGRDDALARKTMGQAGETARTIQAPIFRAAALRDIAVALAAKDPGAAQELFAEAAGLLPPADPDENVQLARSEVAVQWAPFNLDLALAEADLIGDAPLREACCRRICEALAGSSPDLAMQAMARIHDTTQRALALAALAAALAGSQPETAAGMARSALSGAEAMGQAERDALRADAAVALAPQAMADALALLQQVEDEKLAGETLRRIVVRLARTQPAEALRMLEDVSDWQAREETLMDMLPQLAQYDAARAVELTNQVLSRRERIRGLLILAAARPAKETQQP